MTDKQIIIDKLKNEIACRENIINHLAEYNIKLENQLKAKEQECKELRFKEKLSQVKDTTEPLNSELPEDKVIREIFLIVNDCINKKVNPYKHALEEIEHQVTELFLGVENKDRTYCKKILDIINSVKKKNVPHKAKDGEQ